MKILVKFSKDFGRMGDLESVFVTTLDELDSIYGKEVYFGEVLGKHSEVEATMEKEDFHVLSEDQYFIEKLLSIFKETICGHNPFNYLENK